MAAAVASRLPAHQIDNTWPVAVWLDEGIRLHNHKAAGAIKYEQKYCENMLPRTAPSVKNPARNFARFCAGFQRRCYDRHPLRNRAGPMVGMDAFNSRFRRFRRLARDLLVVVAAITAVVAIVFLLNLWLTDPDRTNADIGRISDIVGIVQLSAAAVIIVAGGVFAYRKLQLFRDFEPHLTVTQSATHRTVGTQYVHVAVTATLHNSSKVRVEIRESFFRLHQIQPLNDEYIEALYAAAFNSETHTDIDWPVLDEAFHRLGPNELVIEPGEYHNEPCEFIISRDVETVLIYSYFYNPDHFRHSRSAQGWTATTVYDMVKTGC